jgi:hypothetical protein
MDQPPFAFSTGLTGTTGFLFLVLELLVHEHAFFQFYRGLAIPERRATGAGCANRSIVPFARRTPIPALDVPHANP